MKRSAALALSLLSFAAFGQTETTHCMTTAGAPVAGISIRLLVACAPEFSENTLWHLDRIDQHRAFCLQHGQRTLHHGVDGVVLPGHRAQHFRQFTAAVWPGGGLGSYP